jgi:hypothetical protein
MIKNITFIISVFFILSFVSFFSQSCTNAVVVKDKVCLVTQEICKYANLLCDFENNKNINQDLKDTINYQLITIRDSLKAEVDATKHLSKQSLISNKDTLLNKLKEYNYRLKSLYELSVNAENHLK